MTRTAVVVGATSYVGGFVVGELLTAGYKVVAVTRNPELAAVLLDAHASRVHIVSSGMATRHAGNNADVVINLAYLKNVPPHRAGQENRRLVDLVHDLATATACPRVVHASTMAVFGIPLRDVPSPAPIPRRRDDLYIELKCQAEEWLHERAERAGYRLCIVRLGNVIGPGSPTWIARFAQRLLEGKPLGWAGRFGPSNATYVENVAHYFRELGQQAPDTLATFGIYHHVTEFADHSWDELLEPMERTVGVKRVVAAAGSGPGRGSWLPGAVRWLRRAYAGRAGSYARAALSRVPQWRGLDGLLARAKATQDVATALREPVVPAGDAVLCDFLAGDVAAPPHLLPGANLPVRFPEAITRISRWLVEAGFAVARDE